MKAAVLRVIRYLMKSVRVRVTATALLAVGCALAASVALLHAALAGSRQKVLLATAQFDVRMVEEYNPNLDAPFHHLPNGSVTEGYVQVQRDGRIIGASANLRNAPPLWEPGDPAIQSIDDFPRLSRTLYVVNVAVAHKGGPIYVTVVTSAEQYNKSVVYINRNLDFGAPLLLGVVGIICWVIVGRALRPIEMMRREVAEVATIRGAHRLPEPATDDEVGRLARTLNSMLDRIEASAARERRFVSDASHELRSPIANIRTEVEVALHHPELADWSAVSRTVLGENQRMTSLVEGLLLLARSDEGNLLSSGKPTDLRAVVVGVVASYERGQRPVTLVGSASASVAVPQVYLDRMVTNLIDNACRFASSKVEVEIRRTADTVSVEVRDDGPGVPESERRRIFERFVRLDEARDRTEGGFGLGLAIVADLCRHYRGSIEVLSNDPGARFVLSFPSVDVPEDPAVDGSPEPGAVAEPPPGVAAERSLPDPVIIHT